MGQPDDAPGWAEFWNVDEAIECLSGIDDAAIRDLMAACPAAYDDDNHDEHGEVLIEEKRDYDTTKSERARCLANAWGKLSPETQAKLIQGYETDYGSD